jgi:hypothetical protein
MPERIQKNVKEDRNGPATQCSVPACGSQSEDASRRIQYQILLQY